MRWLLVSLGLVSLGCGSVVPSSLVDSGPADRSVPDAGRHDATHEAAGRDSAQDAPGAFPASHSPMPLEKNVGGPVMKSPKLVIITFASDTLAPQIDDFADKVASSKTYWSGTTAEYGVGPVASVLHISLTETPSAALTDGEVQAWLTDKLSGPDAGTLEGGAPWPQPDAETLYMIYYPSGVSISQGGGTSCMMPNGFYGYHNDYKLSATTYVTYSVVATCPPFPMTSPIDSITSIASHEIVEAVTNPLAQDKPAWARPDADHLAWQLPAGPELGDLCAAFGNVFYKPSDVPYLVQRTWSNKAAAAGHDPCQPNGAMPYFNSAPVLTQSVTYKDLTFGTFTTKGIQIPVGGTGTIELDLYSDAPTTGPWTVTASDLSSLFGGPAELEVSFGGKPSITGKNGDKVSLTVKVLEQGQGGTELLWIQSTIGQVQSVWLGLVGSN